MVLEARKKKEEQEVPNTQTLNSGTKSFRRKSLQFQEY